MINDSQQLVGARTKYGRPIKVYDDGFGPLYLYQEAGGLQGIVRAPDLEDAYDICLDEIMDRVPLAELHEAYGLYILKTGWSLDNLYEDQFWLCPEFDKPPCAYLEPTIVPSRLIVGKCFNSAKEAREYAWQYIAKHELDLVEGYEYQPNANGGTGIVAYDLSGQDLRPFTAEEASQLGITIQVTEAT